MKRIVSTLAAVLFLLSVARAQGGQDEIPMATAMRSEGKIYVVVAILVLIVVGLFVYLFTIDRKVSGLEKRFPEGKS